MAITYLQGFPQSSAEMEQWQQKYKFDPAATAYGQKGAWYNPATQVSVEPTPTIPTAPVTPVTATTGTTPTSTQPQKDQENITWGPGGTGDYTGASLSKWDGTKWVKVGDYVNGKLQRTTTSTIPTVQPTAPAVPTLESIQAGIQAVQAQVPAIQTGVQALTQAQQAGLTITPTTTVEEAQQYLTTAMPALPVTPTYDPTQYFNSLAVELANSRLAVEKAYQQQIDSLKSQQETSQAKIDAYIARGEATLEDVKSITQPWQADLEKAERERLKVEENYFANQNSVKELEDLLNQAMLDIQAVEGVTGLAAIRTPRIAKVKEDYQARVGVIEAVMAARNNQISVANNLIDRTITAITNDKNAQLTYYSAVLGFYDTLRTEEGAKLITLTAQERTYVNAQISLLESDMSRAQATADYIKDLMVNPDYAQLMEDAGITMNDTVEQINTKMATATYNNEVIGIVNKMNADGWTQLLTATEIASKPANEVYPQIDSKGNKSYWWKAVEAVIPVEPAELLSVSEAKTLGVPYGTTKQEAFGIMPSEVTAIPATQQRAASMIESVANTTKQLETLINEIGTIGFGPLARIGGALTSLLSAVGLNPQVKAFQALRQSMIGPFARVISGEVGVLTDQDIKRAEGLLPNIGESTAEVTRKLNNLKQLIIEKRISFYEVAGLPITPDLFDL